MTADLVLSLLLALAPRAPHARLAPIAAAIAATDATDAEAHDLATLDFVERTFGLRGAGIPFGLSCRSCRADARSLDTAAARALVILRTGRAQCGPDRTRTLHYYRLGYCGVDREALRRARIRRRLASYTRRLSR